MIAGLSFRKAGQALLLASLLGCLAWPLLAATPRAVRTVSKTPEAGDATVTLTGKAVTVAGVPVPGIKVVITSYAQGEEHPTWTGTSGPDGAFRIDVPASEIRTVNITVVPAEGGKFAPCGVTGGPTISMYGEPPEPITVLCAPATSRITGTVTGPDGKPVAGVSVTFTSASTLGRAGFMHKKTLTDAAGKYEIAGLAAGSYQAGAIDPPRGTALIRLYSWKPGLVRRVELAEGATAVENFQLKAGARLTGRVLDEAGKPVAGASVSCGLDAATEEGPKSMYQMPGQWYSGEGTTDAQGRYAVGGLTKETYHLTIRPPDGTALAPAALRGVNAPDAGDAELQNVTLYKEAKLLGTVVGPDGKPVAGAKVSLPLAGARADAKTSAVTDAAGRFIIAGLPTNKYAVKVVPPAGSTSYETAFDDVGAVSGLAMQPELKMPEGATVAGTITGADGKPVAGADIRLSLGYRQGPQAVTDASGKFKIAGIPPALPHGPPGQGQEIKISIAPPDEGPSLLGTSQVLKDLAGGKTSEVNVQLATGGAFTGLVKGPDGKPAAGCLVVAFQAMGNSGYTSTGGHRTGPDGRYTISQVPPGNWALSVVPSVSQGLGLQFVPARAMAAGQTETVDVTLQTGAVIVGHVATNKGTPVAGSRVHLDLGRDGGIPYMPGMEAQNRYDTITDKSGLFRIIGLPPGTHKIRVDAMDPLLLIEPADAKVAATGDHALEIVAQITGSLRGTIRDAEGKPLTYEYAMLRLQQAAADGKRQYSPFADAEGKFKLAGMVPGKYNLTVQLGRKAAERDLVAPEPIEVEIREAQETQADVKVGTK